MACISATFIAGLDLNYFVRAVMKLAEALLLRSDLQTKLAALQQRINSNVVVQEGDQPSEDPQHLIQQALAVSQELYRLIQAIHHTNAQAITVNGHVLLSMLNQRDLLKAQHQILQSAIEHSRRDNTRYSSSEIRWVKVLKLSELQQQADDISAQLRHNNLEIQASNWQIELIEPF
jgi:hypothetical protein